MQSNIFVRAVPLLKERQFSIDYEKIVEFLGHYKSQDWIYPSALHRKLKLDLKLIYEVLELCADLGLIEQYMEIYCPNCNRYTNQWFKTITDIPEEIYCPHCDEVINNPLEHAIVIYRVN